MTKIRPEGFEPPYPAWSPALPDTPSYVQAHAARFAREMRQLPGHEVSVAPAGGAEATYVSCHGDTGRMPYFEASD